MKMTIVSPESVTMHLKKDFRKGFLKNKVNFIYMYKNLMP